MNNKVSMPPIISSSNNLKFFNNSVSQPEIIDALSDLKHRIFPRPFERLSSICNGRNLVGAEIGVCGGEHALSLLQNIDIEKLYLIDPYDMYDNYNEGIKHYGIDQATLTVSEINARKILHDYSHKITWIRKNSSDAVKDIVHQLDFVYIDGNHQENFVSDDIHNYLPIIKNGGVLGGHDFYNGFQREHDGVVNAVVRFIQNNQFQLRVELPDWWVEV